jgi:hypothetical protein
MIYLDLFFLFVCYKYFFIQRNVKKMKKSTMIRNALLASPIVLLGLTGCGGGGSDSSSDEASLSEVSAAISNDAPSLSEIAGVWDASITIDNEVDEVYIVFKDYGDVIIYDYLGDTFDQGVDCYYQSIESITDLGDGSFEIVSDYSEDIIINIALSGGDLIGTNSYGEFTFSKASLEESDFSPLCSDIFTSYSSTESLSSTKQVGVLGAINQ